MNFTFQRNPERLLDLCGLSPIRDRRQEKLFMEKAAALEAQDLRPLVLVIGGFLDQILGNSYAVSARYPADLRAKHDVWFREHYESRKMRDIVNIYASKGHSVSNINRQIIATTKTVGQYKTDAMEARILDINPAAKITKHNCFFLPETAADFPFNQYDYVVDAVDTMSAKLALVTHCHAAGVPIICAMGAGNKLDPTGFQVADPASVVFDTIAAGKARSADVIIIDTAGRLHNKKNLMDELNKISRVIERELPGASKEVLLVLDATTGQNAVNQAKDFKDAAGITGIVLTKLDGTARGGVVLAINNELDVPVKFVGVGEQIDDLQPFDADAFAAGLFDKAPTEVDEEEIASFIGSAEAAADEKAEKGSKN